MSEKLEKSVCCCTDIKTGLAWASRLALVPIFFYIFVSFERAADASKNSGDDEKSYFYMRVGLAIFWSFHFISYLMIIFALPKRDFQKFIPAVVSTICSIIFAYFELMHSSKFCETEMFNDSTMLIIAIVHMFIFLWMLLLIIATMMRIRDDELFTGKIQIKKFRYRYGR